jgi:predicted MPP superfamily phosphohydrolase
MPSTVDPQERLLSAPPLTGIPEKSPRAKAAPMPSGFLARVLPRLGIGVLLIGSLHYYIGSRVISRAGLPDWVAFLAWTTLWLLLVSIPGGLLSWRLLPAPIARRIRSISNLWIGVFGVLLSAVVLTDIARMVWLAAGQATAEQRATAGVVQALAIVLLVVPAVLIGIRTARGSAKLEKIRVPIPRLGREFDGFRIVQLSDLHVSESVPTRFLDAIVDRVNAMQADVVAVTGDLIDGGVEDLRERVAPLGRLRARDGVFFVTGNHEYYHGVHAWEAEVKRLGVAVLHNEHRVLRRGADAIVLAGVPDYHGGQFDPSHESRPALAFLGAPEEVPRILLAHQPRSVVEAAAQRVDLQISGHTHGGQIFPFMFFVRLQQPVVSGLRKLHGIWVYTSRGTGYWGPPMRIGSSPEITEITLYSPTSKF